MAISYVDEREAAPEAWRAAGGDRGLETILVVDDEPIVRSFTSEVLAMEGYTVIEASGTAECLRVAKEHAGPIHLVISDVVLPEGDGRDLVAQLGRLRPAITPLYISGHSESDVVRRTGPAAAFLQKPFTMDRLIDAVRAVLDGARRSAARA